MTVDLARLLLICPHPDDETLGAGLLLQETISRGGKIRIVYLTDGERNPIPQMIAEKRLPLGRTARARWGSRRRLEALRALALLGIDRRCAEFWGLPDQGLGRILRRQSGELVQRLNVVFRTFAPTILVSPSAHDLHDDHHAAAVLCGRAAEGLPFAHHVYQVHGSPAEHKDGFLVRSTPSRFARKAAALKAHETQMRVSQLRLLHTSMRPETFATEHEDACRKPLQWRELKRIWSVLSIGEFRCEPNFQSTGGVLAILKPRES